MAQECDCVEIVFCSIHSSDESLREKLVDVVWDWLWIVPGVMELGDNIM